jgi:hypothetical protein
MKKLSRAWKLFLAIQTIGLTCLFGSSVTGASAFTPVLWSVGYVLLLPGDAWPAALVEKALWLGPLSNVIVPLELLVAVLANAALWFIVLFVVRRFRPARVA